MIAYEANKRWQSPPIINLTSTFFFVAILGLLANIYATIILKPEHRETYSKNKNKFYLFIHMVFDTIGSVIVLTGAIQISRTNTYSIDSVSSFILAGLIVLAAIWLSLGLMSKHEH